MKSLVWVNQFALLPGDGGGTRHFELGRQLRDHDWEVTVMASDLHLHSRGYTRRPDEKSRETIVERKDGVEFRWLWAAPYEVNNWRRAWNWLSFHRSVTREGSALHGSTKVVIGSSPQLFAATAARALARRAGVPFVFEVRDLWPESLLAAGGRRGAAYRLLDHVAAGLYRDADRIIVLARGSAKHLEDRGVDPAKIYYVPNGVDTALIKPARGNRPAISSAAPFRLIYAGAHGPANGLDTVLEAADILRGNDAVQFVLVGDGPAKAQLRAEANDRALTNVEFRDPVSKYELAGLLNEADAGLMVLREAPLFSFGVSPNKLFDYLAAALPVVCNVPGEVAGMLADAEGGVQAVDSSAPALAEAIVTLTSQTNEVRQTMGAAGRQWVEREHSREVLAKKLDACLGTLLQN